MPHAQSGNNILKNNSDRCKCPITELVEFISTHQPVSVELILIDESSRVVIWSVWGFVGDVGYVVIRLGDVKLLLVALDSQLKIFNSLLNDDTSCEHPKSYIQILEDIS
ncbi:hypothetical protein Tco_0965384 [Tanacetum coccineum]